MTQRPDPADIPQLLPDERVLWQGRQWYVVNDRGIAAMGGSRA
jgi:hypothetical protein